MCANRDGVAKGESLLSSSPLLRDVEIPVRRHIRLDGPGTDDRCQLGPRGQLNVCGISQGRRLHPGSARCSMHSRISRFAKGQNTLRAPKKACFDCVDQ